MVQIEINNLSKKIKGVTVLNNVNLTLTGGKCYGLEGKNGSGKTMLMSAISGLIPHGKATLKIKVDIFIIPICTQAEIAYFIWVSFLNLNYGKTDIINCHIGENISENAYQYKATEYNILTEKEFEKKYGVEIDDEQFKMYADFKILTVNM